MVAATAIILATIKVGTIGYKFYMNNNSFYSIIPDVALECLPVSFKYAGKGLKYVNYYVQTEHVLGTASTLSRTLNILGKGIKTANYFHYTLGYANLMRNSLFITKNLNDFYKNRAKNPNNFKDPFIRINETCDEECYQSIFQNESSFDYNFTNSSETDALKLNLYLVNNAISLGTLSLMNAINTTGNYSELSELLTVTLNNIEAFKQMALLLNQTINDQETNQTNTEEDESEKSWIDKAKDNIKESFEAAKEYADKVMDKSKEFADKAKENINDSYEAAKEYADKARDKSKEFTDKAKEKSKEFADKAKENIKESYEAAKEYTDKAMDKSKEFADKAKESIKESYEAAKKYADKAKEKSKEFADKAFSSVKKSHIKYNSQSDNESFENILQE